MTVTLLAGGWFPERVGATAGFCSSRVKREPDVKYLVGEPPKGESGCFSMSFSEARGSCWHIGRSNLWHYDPGSSSIKFVFENSTVKLQNKQTNNSKTLNILRKFTILCWAIFIAILDHMWPEEHRPDIACWSTANWRWIPRRFYFLPFFFLF